MNEEIWRPLYGYEGIYEVSNHGRIRHIWIMAQQIAKVGYPVITLHKDGIPKTHWVHQLVAETFIGKRPDGFQVNHRDFDKKNNHVDNLEWMSRRHNMAHAHANGRFKRGEECSASKLTQAQVDDIRASYSWQGKHGLNSRQLAEKYHVSQSQVLRIVQGLRWPTVYKIETRQREAGASAIAAGAKK